MEYTYKYYIKETAKDIPEKRIATISDLHFGKNLSNRTIDEILIQIHDILPEYLFILGDLFPYEYLNNKDFKGKVISMLKVLSQMTKVYLIFGNKDYGNLEFSLIDNEKIGDLKKTLVEFYQSCNVNALDNSYLVDDGLNIIGYNKNPIVYHDEFISTDRLEYELLNFYEKFKNILTNQNFNIFLTHSHLDLLKLNLEFFKAIDLILAGHTHNGLIPRQLENIFEPNTGIITKKKLFINDIRGVIDKDNFPSIIVNGGITKISDSHSKLIKSLSKNLYTGEIDLIKIKKKSY